MNFVQANYQKISLDDVAEHFHLSVPYLSKYIKDKSGKNFSEHVTAIRMKRAKVLLKNGTMTVEDIAETVGYPSVEHFNRTFKKNMGTTPSLYRKKKQAQ